MSVQARGSEERSSVRPRTSLQRVQVELSLSAACGKLPGRGCTSDFLGALPVTLRSLKHHLSSSELLSSGFGASTHSNCSGASPFRTTARSGEPPIARPFGVCGQFGYLVDPASSICLSQRLSHASLSTHGRYSETANGSLNQLWFL